MTKVHIADIFEHIINPNSLLSAHLWKGSFPDTWITLFLRRPYRDYISLRADGLLLADNNVYIQKDGLFSVELPRMITPGSVIYEVVNGIIQEDAGGVVFSNCRFYI